MANIGSTERNILNSLYDSNGTTLTTDISSLGENLDKINNNLKYINDVALDALSRQTEVNTIITNENERLKIQANSLNNAKQGQNRIINLNDSYRKRYTQYLKIIIAKV